MEYTEEFNEVMEFYRNSTPKQHQQFLNLIADKLTFFNYEQGKEYTVDEEYLINFNGIYHQINVK
tara:strand:+ start:804 stop:998 length:195 start_codon:yes stop_codon:yes gene_type:complete